MMTTGWKELDNLLFRNDINLVEKVEKQDPKLREFNCLDEIMLFSNGKFKNSSGKEIKVIIIGLQSIAVQINYIRSELVLNEIKDFRNSLYPEANAYVMSLPNFFRNTKSVGDCFAKEEDYMSIAVLYCKI